jgi:hypothetical protein
MRVTRTYGTQSLHLDEFWEHSGGEVEYDVLFKLLRLLRDKATWIEELHVSQCPVKNWPDVAVAASMTNLKKLVVKQGRTAAFQLANQVVSAQRVFPGLHVVQVQPCKLSRSMLTQH